MAAKPDLPIVGKGSIYQKTREFDPAEKESSFWGKNFPAGSKELEIKASKFPVSLLGPAGERDYVLIVNEAAGQPKLDPRLKFNCLAYALKTCDPVTGQGFIPTQDCVQKILNNPLLATTVRDIDTQMEEKFYGRPDIAVGDVIIFYGQKPGSPAERVPVHGCVITEPLYDAKPMRKDGVLSMRTKVNTKNGPAEIQKDVTLLKVHEEYNEENGQQIAPEDREIGIYRLKVDFAALEK